MDRPDLPSLPEGQREIMKIVDKVFGGAPERPMSASMDYRGLSPEEVQRIQALLAKSQERSRPKGKRS